MSAVWNVFRKTTDEYGNILAICTVCSRSLKVPKSKTTTNLLAHLRNNHCDELNGCVRRRFDAAIPRSSGACNTSDHRSPAHRRLAQLVIDGTLPLEATSLKSFRDFVSSLNPSFHTPSVRTLRNILEEEHSRIEITNKTLLAESSSKIALTLDFHRTFRTHSGLLLVTGHFLSKNSVERRILVLDCVPLELESFSGKTLSQAVTSCLGKLDVDVSRIATIVANENQPLQEAAHYINAKFVPCVAHSINLSVSDTINPANSFGVLEKLRTIVSELQHNNIAKIQLKSRLREFKLPELWPVLDSTTSWHSAYDLICEVLTTLPAFNDVLGKLNQPCLEAEEVRFLEAIRTFLEPFSTIRKQVCSRDATCSMYLAVGRILIATTRRYISQSCGETQRFGRCLLANTSKCFNPWLSDEFLQTAACLDPRFAYLETIQSMKSWMETVEKFVISQGSIDSDKNQEILKTGQEGVVQELRPQQVSVWEILRESCDEPDMRSVSSWKHGDELRVELQHYAGILRNSRPAFGTDPLHWWRAFSNEFPLLANAAYGYLGTPATSADTERLLSLNSVPSNTKNYGNINRKFDRLLMMLKANMNKDVSRECKAWSRADIHRYGFQESSQNDFDEFDIEEDILRATCRSDEERDATENVEPLPSFVEDISNTVKSKPLE